MLCPSDRAIPRGKILHGFPDLQTATAEFDGSLKIELSQREVSLGYKDSLPFSDLIGNHGALAVHGQPGGGFFSGRSAEKIETQIVAHDAGQELGL